MSQRTLSISHFELPPSDNHIRDIGYRFINGKRRACIVYTKEADNFKKSVVRRINDAYFFEVQEFARAHRPWMTYKLTTVFVFAPEDILTAGWLKGTAKSPYKRVDTKNRSKLLDDALSEAIGIDDSLFFEGPVIKLVGGDDDPPAVHLVLTEEDPTAYGVPTHYLRGPHG